MRLCRQTIVWSIVLLVFPLFVHAQKLDNLRLHIIDAKKDTILIDTLSIIPGSIRFSTSSGVPVPATCYTLDPAKAQLIWNRNMLLKEGLGEASFIFTYRVFPFLFTKPVFHKELKYTEPEVQGNENPYIYSYNSNGEDIFKFGGLNKSGNISRGLSFGNNQDIVVNSSLNLQLSGKLSEDVGILAAITDNNIPIQPEGNTQQIQEFDKVYIQLFTKNTKLTAGDFELTRPPSYFMNLDKKAQGGLLTTRFDLPKTKNNKPVGIMNVTAGGAISKGKYARNLIDGMEGNQGPYKLKGNNGETYIIILAGTEKVYIDGKSLIRGADNDYTIDYNLGEITFTPKNLITKDKRISVEFEYSDKNYARSMFYAASDYQGKHGAVRFNFFSEQDLKNQPVQQALSAGEKQLLYRIGDSLWLAVVPSKDSIAFNNNEVLYRVVDTTVNFITYDSVYVYSTDPNSAHYRLGFSNMGQGRGNYIQVQSSANGRVFRWVAPLNGVPQGTYEPVVLLIAPKKTQMYTLAGDYRFGKNTFASAEVALSNNDINTFSPADSYDDIGYATHFTLNNRLKLGHDSIKGWNMVTGISHDYSQQYFNPVERYRSVEFDRDWNLGTTTNKVDEHNPAVQFGFENKKNQFVTYRFKSLLRGTLFRGYCNTLDGAYDLKNFFITLNGSYLTTRATDNKSIYIKHKAGLLKKLPWFTLGVKEETEHNSLIASVKDTLTPSSFAFEQYEAFFSSPDSAKTRFMLNYKRRFDRFPFYDQFIKAATADDIGAGFELTKDPNSLLKLTGTWRKLQINDTTLSHLKPDNSLLGRIEFFTRKLHKVITSNTYYEIGSGLEVKKEFSYLQVPAGQGIYSWTDYNGDGIKQLNEFEVAAFSDQANYIRVFTPTNQYIRAYYSKFNEALNIEPAEVWANKKGLRKLISRFALQGTYHVERKTTDNDLLRSYNPFKSTLGDTSLVTLNSNFRAAMFFNRSNPRFACDVEYQDNRNKSLLVNGFDSRTQSISTARFRWNVTRKLVLSAEYNNGIKTSSSDYFSSRDFHIKYSDIQPRFSFQPGNKFRLSLTYIYSEKMNTKGNPREVAYKQNAGIEMKYNILTKGSLLIKGNYILLKYNAEENNSLAFEMLEGFKKGNNATWSVSFQRNLSGNMQLDLNYDGRKASGSKMVHVGSVQLRAYF